MYPAPTTSIQETIASLQAFEEFINGKRNKEKEDEEKKKAKDKDKKPVLFSFLEVMGLLMFFSPAVVIGYGYLIAMALKNLKDMFPTF